MTKFPKTKNYSLSLWDDDLFDDFFSFPRLRGELSSNIMKTDIIERDNEYLFKIDIPGVKKENAKIEVDDGYLSINLSVSDEKEEKQDRYIKKERYYENCSRSFYIGDVDESKIKASYEEGTLNIIIPKEEKQKKETKKIIDIK